MQNKIVSIDPMSYELKRYLTPIKVHTLGANKSKHKNPISTYYFYFYIGIMLYYLCTILFVYLLEKMLLTLTDYIYYFICITIITIVYHIQSLQPISPSILSVKLV